MKDEKQEGLTQIRSPKTVSSISPVYSVNIVRSYTMW